MIRRDERAGRSSASKLPDLVQKKPAVGSDLGPSPEAVLAHARETFGSEEKANHWLRRPNHVFKGQVPLDLVKSDPQAVEIELTRIDHGVYI